VYPWRTNWVDVKVRIRKTPEVEEVDGIRVNDMEPGSVREVSSSIAAWLIAERYAVPEMRREFRTHEEDFLGRETAPDQITRVPRRRRNER
jgi:hypothetical protein